MTHMLETVLWSLWKDGIVYQGVSMAIRVICQGPWSLGWKGPD